MEHIESIEAKKPVSWYKDEINKTYRNLHEAIHREKEALRIYNSLMISVFELGYLATKSKDKDLKERYKRTYQLLEKEFKNVCDSVIARKGYSDYLKVLKQGRQQAYESEFRK